VCDDDGLVDFVVVVVRVNVMDEVADGGAEAVCCGEPWGAGGVVVVPDLVFAVEVWVVFDGLSHVHEGCGGGDDAMNHDDGDAVFIVGAREVDSFELAVVGGAEESFEFESGVPWERGEVVDADVVLGGEWVSLPVFCGERIEEVEVDFSSGLGGDEGGGVEVSEVGGFCDICE